MRFLWIIGCSVCVLLSAEALALTTQDAKKIAEQLNVTYQVIDNQSQQACDTDINSGRCFSAQLRYQAGETAIPAAAIFYFSHISPIVESDNEAVTIARINGDLHTLQFADGLKPHEQISVTIKAPFWHAARTDVMPNHYMVYPSLPPVIIDSTRRVQDESTGLSYSGHAGNWDKPQQYLRSRQDHMPQATAEMIYRQLPQHWPTRDTRRVIPRVKARTEKSGSVTVRHLAIEEPDREVLGAAIKLLSNYALNLDTRGFPLQLRKDGSLASEGYRLDIDADGITLTSSDATGAQYGFMTLMQLYRETDNSLPKITINDAPRYPFRGVHLDIARHFPGKEVIHTVLDQMYRLKLNALHLHLSDDEGWRLAIPGLPELTDVGAYRCHDPQETQCLLPQLGSGPHRDASGNGFLSVKEYQEIVLRANAYGITLIPSIDMPGHARAAITAMEARYQRLKASQPDAASEFRLIDPDDSSAYLSVQFYDDNAMNPCVPGSYRFIEKVLDELRAMHRDINVPLQTFHFGADEIAGAWTASPACEQAELKAEERLSHFVKRVVALGETRGLTMAGWSDGVEDSLEVLSPGSVQANVWKTLYYDATETINRLDRHEMPVVLSLPDVLYFDFPYQSHPSEPGYYWGSKATDTFKVFSFMPAQLSRHDQFWPDRMGNAYTDATQLEDPEAVKGLQAQLWSEVTPTASAVEYMLFPRLFAFAERAWFKARWQDPVLTDTVLQQTRQSDWQEFAVALGTVQIPALIKQGINVRIPPPGAMFREGKLHIRAALPGLIREFRTPSEAWQTYRSPVTLSGCTEVRSRVAGSEKVSRALSLGCDSEETNKKP